MRSSRRDFVRGAAALAGAVAFASPALAGQDKARPKVVVIGGGAGGATAAKYIALDSRGAVDVLLIEEAANYQTCFFSNHYLGGLRSFETLVHSYDKLPAHGVTLVRQRANAIDRERKQVVLADGKRLDYDRLVVSPGIELVYDAIPGWGREAEDQIPHAFKPGRQMQILKSRLDAVPDGGLIVILPPPNPSRCPPAPYERASMMAHALKSSGRGAAKIIIVDPKPRFTKMALFLDGWDRHYKGMIEWLAPDIHEGVSQVDPNTNTVVTGFETYNAALVNLIPAQKAGMIAQDAQLTDASGFCPIDPESMRSAVDPAIFVLGDSCISGDMPKAAFAANAQAKVAAAAICAELISGPKLTAHYANTCWSLLAPGDCVKLSGRYEAADGKIKEAETTISRLDETPDTRAASEREAQGWYTAIVDDMFS